MASARSRESVSLSEALESYAAHHPESIDELLLWPARKWEHFYIKFQQRKIIEGLEGQKNQMIAALWSNSNWDDDKGSRTKAIEGIESNYEEALQAIKTPGTKGAEEEEIDKDNPFFAAAERGRAKVEQRMGYTPPSEDEEDEEEVDYMKGLDQED